MLDSRHESIGVGSIFEECSKNFKWSTREEHTAHRFEGKSCGKKNRRERFVRFEEKKCGHLEPSTDDVLREPFDDSITRLGFGDGSRRSVRPFRRS